MNWLFEAGRTSGPFLVGGKQEKIPRKFEGSLAGSSYSSGLITLVKSKKSVVSSHNSGLMTLVKSKILMNLLQVRVFDPHQKKI
jgi:hypothetical protein